MGKIQSLKSWYSFEETAAHLSQSLAEPVSVSDVVQLAAEGKIRCCWFLKGEHYARRVSLYCPYPPDAKFSALYSELTYDAEGTCWGQSLSGIYEMPVEWCPSWAWWLLTFIGLGGESGDFCGPLVIDEEGTSWELYDEASHGLSDFFHYPKQHEVVFRPSDIAAFESLIFNTAPSGLGGVRQLQLMPPNESMPQYQRANFQVDGKNAMPVLPGISTAPIAALSDNAINGTVKHKLKNRTHALDSVVALAIDGATDKCDYQAVWAAYVKIAQGPTRPAPLIGYIEGEGVKYTSDTAESGTAFDTKKAFTARFKRRTGTR